jgi:hypothetical protein
MMEWYWWAMAGWVCVWALVLLAMTLPWLLLALRLRLERPWEPR